MEIENRAIKYTDIASLLDINRGDILVISSDIRRLFWNEMEVTGALPDIDILIDSFKEKVGEEGTLLFPTFTWKFCKGETYDYHKTKGEVGTLGNAALKRKDFKRTKHPIYSFMVWGKYQKGLCSLENEDSWGVGSPFDFLYQNKAKWLLFDITLDQGYTFVHHVEQLGNVPFRYQKSFTAKYIDDSNRVSERTYSMFVRDLDIDAQQGFAEMEEELVGLGIEKQSTINGIVYSIVDVKSSLQPILDDILNNKSRKLYKYKGQED